MRRTKRFTIVLLVLIGVVGAIALAKSASVLLREGLYAEEVEGDLDAAVGVYKQIIADTSAPKEQVAQALYRLGMCYMKQKDEIAAKATFSKLVNDYGDQTQLVAKVKPLLEELGNADPASLMPPETIAYVEIGSPGKQVETILSMLKGTPFENPLAMIGQNQPDAGQHGPQQIVGALLNPSMMAEFKKIRGMGIGITELAQNNPPMIIVLYPGKSDALRGIIQMALGFVGQPAEAIEGMTTLSFGDGGGAAYDDTVIIVTSPNPKSAGLLQWSVKQYQGLIKEPSLASSNKSFAKINKKARQDNMLTVWVNTDEAYQGLKAMLPPDQMPPQLLMAEGIADLQNIDDIIASLSIRQTALALDANINLKEGYNSLAYNMIRTPSLGAVALNSVPSNAIALVSIALGKSDTPQAQAAGEHIKNATGLDIGRELFDNIEQITLFAVPFEKPTEQLSDDIPPQAKSFGLAITSANPQQTHQILSSVLRSTNVVIGETQPAGGRFDFTLPNYQKLFGYMDPAKKTTILSLNSSLVETAMTATRQGAGAPKSGSLQGALASLPGSTNKLVAINVGGAVQFAEANMELPWGDAADRVREAMGQLAQAGAKTTLCLRTSEEDSSFGVHLSVDGLPPIAQLVGPIMQIADGMSEIEGRDEWDTESALCAGIAPTDRAPVIDGKVDDAWGKAEAYPLKHNFYDSVSGDSDCSASFKTLCDKNNLYVLVDVTDDDLCDDSEEFWLDDGVEIFIDADASRSGNYDDNDYQYFFGWDATSPTMGESHHGRTENVAYAFARTDDGYRLEASLPWSTLKAKPSPGRSMGFDVQVNDDDGGGDRDSKLAWNATEDDAWQNTRAFGIAQPLGLVAWYKLDESDGRTAADSSGNGHDAAVQGDPTWEPSGGKVGGAIALGGDGDFVDIRDESDFDFMGGVTVTAWIKANRLDRPWQAIVTKGDNTWRIQRNNEDSTLEFACTGLDIPGGNDYGSLYGAEAISLGEWHHIAGVYDGKRMAVYVDGVLDASHEASGMINTNDTPVQIGANTDMQDRFWDGMIDEVRLYNYGVSAAEIAKLAGR